MWEYTKIENLFNKKTGHMASVATPIEAKGYIWPQIRPQPRLKSTLYGFGSRYNRSQNPFKI